MKFFKFSILLVFICAGVSAQNVKFDSTYRPGTYDVQVALFEAYKNSTSDIIFLGNSITAHSEWAELLENPHVKNRGISGDITFGILQRLKEVTEGKPAKVFLLIGINDISRNIPDELIINNIQKIVERIKRESPKTKVYLQTILPVNNSYNKFKNHYNKDEHIATVNNGIKSIAKKSGVTLIDSHQIFLGTDGRLEKNYTHDGLHLTAEGYAVWAKTLKKYVEE
ncbi:MAG TPA: GDSL-type esterase/lipase family protein [Pelobium sp.]|nr:GDSL-type esterase/lipase family protein [Pelobium sp.]